MTGNPLHINVYSATESKAEFYEDAGEGFEFEDGVFLMRSFEQVRTDDAISVSVKHVEGSYLPQPRSLVWKVHVDREVKSVSIDGRSIVNSEHGIPEEGWSQENDNFIRIAMPEPFVPMEMTISF